MIGYPPTARHAAETRGGEPLIRPLLMDVPRAPINVELSDACAAHQSCHDILDNADLACLSLQRRRSSSLRLSATALLCFTQCRVAHSIIVKSAQKLLRAPGLSAWPRPSN